MSTFSRFSVQGLFMFMAVVGACFGVLATPSEWWVAFLPVIALFIASVATRQVIKSPRTRPFWAAFGTSFIAYMVIASFANEYGGVTIWRQTIGMEFWSFFHPTPNPAPFGQVTNVREMLNFTACLHFMFAALAATVAGLVVQFSCEKDHSP